MLEQLSLKDLKQQMLKLNSKRMWGSVAKTLSEIGETMLQLIRNNE